MIRTSWRIAVALAMVVVPMGASAQARGTITGRVTDQSTQQPVAGAQVMVVGTNARATTDAQGNYQIPGVAAGQQQVSATRVGYATAARTVSITAGQTATVNFALSASAVALSELVVVGYGTSERRELSTAVTSVRAEQIENTPVASVDAALQGRATGVQVVQNAGNPGNGMTVRVRGASSLSASNQPLFVVDGVPLQTGDFS